MPVSDLHPQYRNKQYEVRQMRDTLEGPGNVKRSGALYLPIPASMYAKRDVQPPTGISYDGNYIENKYTNVVANAPWKHNIPAYQSYLQRARFPDITALIHRGLSGVATKKDPEIILTPQIEYLREKATRDDKSLIEVFRMMVNEVLGAGRVGLLVDVNQSTNQLVLVVYCAEAITNWKMAQIDGDDRFKMVVLSEPCHSDDDEFSHELEIEYKVCRVFLDGKDVNGMETEVQIYNVQDYENDSADQEIAIPLLRGIPYDEIPLVIASSDGTGVRTWTCPLIGVSDIAISIYQKDADMSNSEFITCNPMLVFTGVDSENDETPDIIGSCVTWSLPDPLSKAFYVEPASTCLAHMANRISSLMDEAIKYGVSILGNGNSKSESAETVKMRQAGNSSNLRSIIRSCGEALEDALEICQEWETNKKEIIEGSIAVIPSLELTEMNMTSQEQIALMQSWINGGISHESYLQRLLDAGFKLSGKDVEGELAIIEAEAPLMSADPNEKLGANGQPMKALNIDESGNIHGGLLRNAT